MEGAFSRLCFKCFHNVGFHDLEHSFPNIQAGVYLPMEDSAIILGFNE